MKKNYLVEAKKKSPKKGKGVSKRTYNSKVRKYASAYNKAFHDLTQFVETNCKGDLKKRDVALDSLSEIVDRYINLNVEAQAWCYKRGVNHGEFVCEIMNKSVKGL